MRIEIIVGVLVVLAMGLGACSQPEPVISSYEPTDCLCEEEVEGAQKAESAELKNEEEVEELAEPLEAVEPVQIVRDESVSSASAMPGLAAARVECKRLLGAADEQQAGADGADNPGEQDTKVAKKEGDRQQKKPQPAVATKPAESAAGASRIDLNTATLSQLIGLPGVGPALAGRIVEYRQKRRFGKPAHLMRVKGIGTAKYAKIMPFVAVGARAAR